jgi:FKBP-type peptidyl-prolyl cis-trans isomerase 2
VEDKVVELQNSQWAKVVKVSESAVVLDANPMLAGLQRRLTIEILGIERPNPAAEG